MSSGSSDAGDVEFPAYPAAPTPTQPPARGLTATVLAAEFSPVSATRPGQCPLFQPDEGNTRGERRGADARELL